MLKRGFGNDSTNLQSKIKKKKKKKTKVGYQLFMNAFTVDLLYKRRCSRGCFLFCAKAFDIKQDRAQEQKARKDFLVINNFQLFSLHYLFILHEYGW